MGKLEDYWKKNLFCENCNKPFSVYVPKGKQVYEDSNLKVMYWRDENKDGEVVLKNIPCSMCNLDKGIVQHKLIVKDEK